MPQSLGLISLLKRPWKKKRGKKAQSSSTLFARKASDENEVDEDEEEEGEGPYLFRR